MKKRGRHGDFYKFVLLALLKEGPLKLRQLEDITKIMLSQFELVGVEFGTRIVSSFFSKFGRPAVIRSNRNNRRRDELEIDIASECQDLLKKELIELELPDTFKLTNDGEKMAREFETNLKKSVTTLESKFLNPSSAARNTLIIDFFLAILKLYSGFISGSVGLIADGADATLDTASAFLVWLGIKIKNEIIGTVIILLMMYFTGITLSYESFNNIIEAFKGNISPITNTFLVISTELIALISAIIMFFYQRFVGKSYGSLSLISQSVDSKNHIYVAISVILAAVLSNFGIPFLDSIIGGFVGIKILKDSIDLSRETLSSMKGEELDLKKYELPLQKEWQTSKIETFKTWTLLTIKEDNLNKREEIINELEHTFKPKYLPILSEFRFSLGEGFDFKESFNTIINPLLEEKCLIYNNGEYSLTDKGLKYISEITRIQRYKK